MVSKLEEELLQKVTTHGGRYQHPSSADEFELGTASGSSKWFTPFVPGMFDISAILLALALLLPYRKRITR